MAISGVLGDIGVTSAGDLLRRGQGCEPVVAEGIIIPARDGFLRGGACICIHSVSGMVHHGRRRVAQFVPVDRAGRGCGGFITVYMAQ